MQMKQNNRTGNGEGKFGAGSGDENAR